jgi:periplasmic protein TonB
MVSQPLPIAVVHPGGDHKPKQFQHPPNAQPEDTFMKALLELPCEYKHRDPLEWACSVLLHAAAITALIIAPLYFTQVIDLNAFQNTWLVAPAPPGPPPPPAAPVVQRTMKSVARLMQGGKMMAPSAIPKEVVIVREEPLPPDAGGGGVIGGVPGGIPGGQVGGVLGGIIGGGVNPVAAVAPPPPPMKRILRVGGNLKPPKQIYSEAPIYPMIAKQAQIQGTVIIDAIIDEQGNVVRAHVVSGPGLLMQAALEAVTKWKYEPTRLNGEPISIEMHVQVNFILQ